ncbi:MAG: glucosidase [Planctomycetota bacterium]|nr:glucosidase [Planctomycetota bacterium]
MAKNASTEASRRNTAEHARLQESHDLQKAFIFQVPPWRRWGCFLSERSWGTVREDYSPDGAAWGFLTYDQARSKAFRWGEDGIAGICDRYQIVNFSIALWNGKDPILKERLFGLSGQDGNHGEDVKEYYFYVDNLPSHAYMKYQYKYPQGEYPYQWLADENRKRGGGGFEFELLDTGLFDEDRYFDIVIEYAKAGPDDICIRVEAFNRGPEDAELHLIPQLWFRNSWSWKKNREPEPRIEMGPEGRDFTSIVSDDSSANPPSNLPTVWRLGPRFLYAKKGAEAYFTNNETNHEAVYGQHNPESSSYVKDAFHRHIVNGEDCINPARFGTKACFHCKATVAAGGSQVFDFRYTDEELTSPLQDIEKIVVQRRKDADEFYESIHPPKATEDEKNIQRQAFAGLLWSKQIYLFDVNRWLEGDNEDSPPPSERWKIRNPQWRHLNSMRILSMPDKWEYPWFAAWDLAFHCVPFALIDIDYAKEMLVVMLHDQFQHPNGQIPAYEWEFSDLNPPVHAWACWKVYNIEKEQTGKGDRAFLERTFLKLLINFAWWINKVDSSGNNVFEGGFLGLDNISLLDRSESLPEGAVLEQSDATGWMGMFCLNLMRIALELAEENKVYEGLATKFSQHFFYVGAAMKHMGKGSGKSYQLWDEKDGFFYDVLLYPNGHFQKFRVRSLVGLIPLYAVEVLAAAEMKPHPRFQSELDWFLKNRKDMIKDVCFCEGEGDDRKYVLGVVSESQLRRILQRLWDKNEFLSEHGVRSLSKAHELEPFVFGDKSVGYEPAEAVCKIKGGNSNWRGPLWFPTSYLIIESLKSFSNGFGDGYEIHPPGARGKAITPRGMGEEIANRMISIFARGKDGRRPVYGGTKKFQEDPHWKDLILFYEYFHGDNGAGLGASHQTGWTGLVASMIDEWRR